MTTGQKFWLIFALKMALIFAACLGLLYGVLEYGFWDFPLRGLGRAG